MTPRFKVGDIAVWENKNENHNIYFLITGLSENFYDIKDLSTGIEDLMLINIFEKEFLDLKEARLITDEEKLELL